MNSRGPSVEAIKASRRALPPEPLAFKLDPGEGKSNSAMVVEELTVPAVWLTTQCHAKDLADR